MIKWLILLVIFFLTVLVGYCISLKYKNRKLLYADLVQFCVDMKSEIVFLKTDIKTLVVNKIKNYNAITQTVISNHFNNVVDNSSVLKINENEEIQQFLDSLGKRDVDGEISLLNAYETKFREVSTKVNSDYDKYGTFCIKMAVVIGLLICVVLI